MNWLPSNSKYLRGPYLVTGVTVLTGLFLFWLVALVTSRSSPAPVVRVDMSVSAGGVVELYIHDPGKVPYRLPVKQGIRTTYAFPLRSDEISYFRLDPTDAGNANIDIYGITVEGRPGDTLQLTPKEIAGWSTANVSSPRRQNGLVEFTSTTDDPVLQAPRLLWRASAGIDLPAGIHILFPRTSLAKTLVTMMTLAIFAAFAWLIWITIQTLGPHVRLVTTRLRSGWGVAIVAFAVAAVALALQHAAEVQHVTLTVDMLVDRGGAVEVYLNDPSLPPSALT